ncbi:hypothetical protein C0995_016720, partial [Termitomyces sp. Mi166
MAPKISLLKVSANTSLLERECAAQEFVIATDAVFFKAQEWRCKTEVHQACVNLWSLNKQASWCAEFGKTVMVIELEPTAPIVVPKTVMEPVPTPASATSLIQHGKGKAKAMEDEEDEESEATQKLRKELEDFVVPTK